jgi:membrane fusion protein (multidrug efflux system)
MYRNARRARGRAPRLAALLLAAGLAGLGVMLAACSDKGQAPAPDAGAADEAHRVQVRVQRVEPVLLRDVLTLPGETEPDADVVLSAETDGAVEWVGPVEGQRVAKGEVLMRIDVAAKRALLEQAEVSSRLAEIQAGRRERLYQENVLSREELDESRTSMEVARATAAEARAEFVQGEVRAPIAGVVESLDADPGEYVSKGQQLMELVDRDVVRVIVSVPELDVRYLSPGSEAGVTVDAWPGRQWKGRVSFVSAKADSATRTFSVRVLVDNADGAIRPGMLARASFLRREIEGAVTAPLSAVQDKGGERLLFVEEDGTARARTVELGVIQGGVVQILSGLALGENLIIAGQGAVEDGVRVDVQ